MLDINFT